MDHHSDPPDLLLRRRLGQQRLWLRLWLWLQLWLRLQRRLRLQQRLRLLRSAEKRSARELGPERGQKPRTRETGPGITRVAGKATERPDRLAA